MSAPKQVLIVDDDEAIREIVELVLTEEGYEVLSAADGAAALRLLQQRPADVILLDMKMPVMDGWAFARQYHALFDRAAPIIVITAAQDVAERAREIEAEGYLAKPFELDELLETIERHLT